MTITLPVLGIFSPTPSFRPVNFRKKCLKPGSPCAFYAKARPINLMQILRESTQDRNEQCTNMCHLSTFFAICEQRQPLQSQQWRASPAMTGERSGILI